MTKRGLVLVVGATGSGKSTTLAAMIDHRNRTSAGHVITVEDPVEYVHPTQMSLVNSAGAVVQTRKANSLGGLLFRNVAPASGYRVRRASDGVVTPPLLRGRAAAFACAGERSRRSTRSPTSTRSTSRARPRRVS